MSKRCRVCGIVLTKHNRYPYTIERNLSICRKCDNAARKKSGASWRAQNKDKCRGYRLKTSYGISLEDYNDMFVLQQGCCAICGVHQRELKLPLCVDHNHNTGSVRGLLCKKCNTVLGLCGESIEALKASIQYLKKK